MVLSSGWWYVINTIFDLISNYTDEGLFSICLGSLIHSESNIF